MTPRAFLLSAALLLLIQISGGRKSSKLWKNKDGACNCTCGELKRGQRVVGGSKAVPHEFPWVAMISYAGTFYCGATLLTPSHLLTAAHCLYGRPLSDLKITLGEHDRNRNDGKELERGVKKVMMHANFSLSKIEHDIALLELSEPVPITLPHIRTACLPSRVGQNYSGLTGVVAGWGRVGESSWTSGTLRKVSLPLITKEECSKMGYSPKRITETVFCAGYPQGKKDACQGDSGGPIQMNATVSGRLEVIGIVSWGRGCGRPNYPGVYTRVDQYLPWIRSKLEGHCLCPPPPVRH